jgi:uncharacterized membrane protein YiaA
METRRTGEGCGWLLLSGGVVLFAVGLMLAVVELSSDAAGMAVGLLFGVLAGIPTALLTIYSMQQAPPPRGDQGDQVTVRTVYLIQGRDDIQRIAQHEGKQ